MGVLLTILKVVGIILGCLLLFLLLVLCLVLFTSLKYRVSGSYNSDTGDINALVKASWLLHIVSFRLVFEDKKLNYKAKVFGITIMSDSKGGSKASAEQIEEESFGEFDSGPVRKQDYYSSDELMEQDFLENAQDNDSVGMDIADEIQNNVTSVDTFQPFEAENSDVEAQADDGDKPGVIQRVAHKITTKVNAVVEKVRGILNKISDVKNKADRIIHNDAYRDYFKKVLWNVKKILLTILPSKHYAKVKYGADDPASVGQITGYYAMARCVLPLNVDFTPDFEEKIIDVDGYLAGRFRLISLVIPALKVVLDKRLRRLIKEIKR